MPTPQPDTLAAAIAELSALRAHLVRLERQVDRLRRVEAMRQRMEKRRGAPH